MTEAQREALELVRQMAAATSKAGNRSVADELSRIIVRERRRHAEEYDGGDHAA